ncbi:uncharacterized protein TEOVI_000415100 [Trypanosoma equiperdum]|uniref:Uncharacterized protein n=2 Tax=Trypanozoon TaxID=39700 RepID=Q585A2_TRYB2|nr:hypothetical protein, conserved [Trypanosoma brucei brucei TREU927]AAX80399.1 hypothetical protein, conserved [Trypanosoma brucei]AAZ11708.1 hypothetical protein, conserved [Trypanosoma brucei brucei TREU927]SCU72574.1 hypothetical protein, conserved [Trypanosoma equiperdum]
MAPYVRCWRRLLPLHLWTRKRGEPARPRRTLLSTSHPLFGQQQATLPTAQSSRRLLPTDHPVFGTKGLFRVEEPFKGPIRVSGFFLAIDPHIAAGPGKPMNPNAQITVSDKEGNMSRVRYRCLLESRRGLRLEALIRMQVGWISPKVTFRSIPHVIHLGKGFDVSIPLLMHFTMVSVLDECGNKTGSFLYLSGTPLLGFSVGFTRITQGKLILDPSRSVNPAEEARQFVGGCHVRQLGFLFLKCIAYVLCLMACFPTSKRVLQFMTSQPGPTPERSKNLT